MTITQRYRHIPILAPQAGAGADRYSALSRAALVKKALIALYGDEAVSSNPAYYVALLHTDTQQFINQLALDPHSVNNDARSIRKDHDYHARSQAADTVPAGE